MTDVAATLEAVAHFVRRFVVLTEAQLAAVTLWVFHTWAFQAADTTAYLSVCSAEKRSGKTRLLEVIELLVKVPLPTANISDAALFRAITLLKPTLLFDEIDAIFGPRARDREDLRGMLNAGYRRGAVARRMGGANNTVLEAFDVYCAKVFAGIGELPDTLRDRSIVIRLERRTRDEPIDRFRRRDVEEQAEPIRQSCQSLADHHLATLTYARPDLPGELDDRAQDVWEPLLAIAELAGDGWHERARAAAICLSTGDSREDESLGARLLADIRDTFDRSETKRLRTADLIAELAQVVESPWGDWYGKTISPQALSKLLKPYRIKTMPVWVGGATAKGYKAEQFEDAWLRVLGVRQAKTVRSESASHPSSNPPNAPNSTTREPRFTLAGDDMYPLVLANAGRDNHITRAEFTHLLEVHRVVEAAITNKQAAA
jgi:hypothetical protein